LDNLFRTKQTADVKKKKNRDGIINVASQMLPILPWAGGKTVLGDSSASRSSLM